MANLAERKNAPRQGKKSAPKTGGKFVESMSQLAKKHSKGRSENPLQVGNVETKHAPQGGKSNFDSTLAHGDDDEGLEVQSTDAQSGLNPEQQGGMNNTNNPHLHKALTMLLHMLMSQGQM